MLGVHRQSATAEPCPRTPPTTLDEALDRAREGDEAGFLLLWRTLQPRLLRYLTIREGSAADDLAAETWLHVVRDLPRFAGDAQEFRAWLFSIARNRSIDAGRARERAPLHLVEDVRDLDVHPPSVTTTDGLALDRLSTERALAILRTLPRAQADLVALRVLAGLDVARVAEMTGKTPGAVRVAVHRALTALSAHPEALRAREESQ